MAETAIEVIGPDEGDERRTAEALRQKILQLWPDLHNASSDKIHIYAAAKLFGRKTQDFESSCLRGLQGRALSTSRHDFDVMTEKRKGRDLLLSPASLW